MRPRAIPVLLVEERYVVKTVRFRRPAYVGDPINSVKLFNEKLADELMILDIRASERGVGIDYAFIAEIAGEAFMPIAYGGGISSLAHAERLFHLGVEKLVVNTASVTHPSLIGQIADSYGSQAIVASVDVNSSRLGRQAVTYRRGRQVASRLSPGQWARQLEASGAGEILVTDVRREGTRSGYNLQLIAEVSAAVSIPVIAHGGAGSLADLGSAIEAGASAAAAGSLFVQHGAQRAVLITYPTDDELTTSLQRKAT